MWYAECVLTCELMVLVLVVVVGGVTSYMESVSSVLILLMTSLVDLVGVVLISPLIVVMMCMCVRKFILLII